MSLYRSPDRKTVETVTVRLTTADRNLLHTLAEAEQMTLSDLIRTLVARRAEEIHLELPPKPPPKRRPGRPRSRPPGDPVETALAAPILSQQEATVGAENAERASFEPERTESAASSASPAAWPAPLPYKAPALDRRVLPDTFRELVTQFREQFADRAEGTRRELEETIRVLVEKGDTEPLLPIDLPLAQLDSNCLVAMRARLQALDMRMAKKNLVLTYLRMMLHWAVKTPSIPITVNPAVDLSPFTLRELGGALGQAVF